MSLMKTKRASGVLNYNPGTFITIPIISVDLFTHRCPVMEFYTFVMQYNTEPRRLAMRIYILSRHKVIFVNGSR